MNGWILIMMDGVIDIWMEEGIDVVDDSVKLNSPTRLRVRDNMKPPRLIGPNYLLNGSQLATCMKELP